MNNNIINNYLFYLKNNLPYLFGYINNNNIIIVVPINKLIFTLNFLKYHTHSQFKILSDIVGIDYIYKYNSYRFNIEYHLLSIRFNNRIRIKIYITQFQKVNSIINVFESANWLEREIWDMFGIFFKNHPDLRRILTDYGFEGYPLRKDFPISGYLEIYYDEVTKGIVYRPLNLSQVNRIFNFHFPWENVN